MQLSLRAMMSGLVDYAGLFPPAKLPLEQALRNYARYRQEPESWMLGRFIIPAARLEELTPFAELFTQQPPFLFSALGRGGTTVQEFLKGLEADLSAITQFHQRHAGKAVVDVLETKLPGDVQTPDSEEAATALLARAVALYEEVGPGPLTPYYEATLTGDWRTNVGNILRALSTTNARTAAQRTRSLPGGFKLRCGGLEAAAFPSIEQVAAVITACHEHGVALKCTAGLHHPLRRFDASVQTEMHGFLNVFGAAILADARPWCEELGQLMLADVEPLRFHFDSEGFQWRDLRVSVADIQQARQRAAISFGSCSFDEPRDDLRALQWLP